jgi:hypothetical protein
VEKIGSVEFDPFRIPTVLELCPENLFSQYVNQAGGEAEFEKNHSTLEKLRNFAVSKNLKMITSGLGRFRFIDFCPSDAGKGSAVLFLLKNGLLNCDSICRILVAGDSGNDLDMFKIPGVKSVVVSNSQVSLLHDLVGRISHSDLSTSSNIGTIVALEKGVEHSSVLTGQKFYFSHGGYTDGVTEGIKFYFLKK